MTTSQNDLLEKIKEKFTDEQQKIFVDSFYCYLNKPKDAFIIDLIKVWPWLGFTRKDTCKKLFNKFFIENKDYIVKKELDSAAAKASSIACQSLELAPLFGGASSNTKHGGQNKETILMSVATFKDLCLTSNTKKAKEVRSYFIKLEEIVFDAIKESHLKTTETHKQIGQSDYMIKHFHMKSIVYLGDVEQNEESQIVKYGHTSDIKSTHRRHQQSYGNEFKFLYALECKEHYRLESMIKSHNDLQTRHIKTYNDQPRQELIRLDHHFDLNKFIELINDMQVSLRQAYQSEEAIVSKFKIVELESQVKLQEEITKQIETQEKTKQIETQEKTKQIETQEKTKQIETQEKTKQMELELKILQLKMLQTSKEESIQHNNEIKKVSKEESIQHINEIRVSKEVYDSNQKEHVKQAIFDQTKEQRKQYMITMVQSFMDCCTEHSVSMSDQIYVYKLHERFELWFNDNKLNEKESCISLNVFNTYLTCIGYIERYRKPIEECTKLKKDRKIALANIKFNNLI
jgi:MSV199 domain